jgi:hypothetical protein
VEPGGHSWVVQAYNSTECQKTLVRTTPLRKGAATATHAILFIQALRESPPQEFVTQH